MPEVTSPMIATLPPRSAAAAPALDTYLRQISNTPLLTARQEKELARRVRLGDPEARDHLVRANLLLVVSIARAYQGRGADIQDLVAEGNLGLLRAAEDFDASMNTRFSTYAAFWVKQSIRRALLNLARPIRLPAHVVRQLAEWRRAAAELLEELGRPPSDEEVGLRLGLSARQLRSVTSAVRAHDASAHGDRGEEGTALVDLAADGRAQAPDEGVAEGEELSRLLRLLGGLEPRESAVLRLRFGLGGEEPMTLQQAGERLGLTRERVRQIVQRALGKLRELFLAG